MEISVLLFFISKVTLTIYYVEKILSKIGDNFDGGAGITKYLVFLFFYFQDFTAKK